MMTMIKLISFIVPTCTGTTWRQSLYQSLTRFTTFRQTQPAHWRRSMTTGTATTRSTATAHTDRAWTRWICPSPPTHLTMIKTMTPSPCSWQWPTSPSRGGWATRVVMPQVFRLQLPASSEHQESYRWVLNILVTKSPRTLLWFQAVGKDGIYPGIGWFEKGGNANNDPIRGLLLPHFRTVTLFSSGYFLCFSVAMGFVMIANLNVIGIVASNFFLARCRMDIIDINYANRDKDMRIWIFIFNSWIWE